MLEKSLLSWILLLPKNLLPNSSFCCKKKVILPQQYFTATVKDSIVIKKNKEVNVYYLINTEEPYKIRSINYTIGDPRIKDIVMGETENSLLKLENNYDADILQKERDRVTAILRNRGYFYFSKEYIYCKVDSSLNNRHVDLFFGIKPRQEIQVPGTDSVITDYHHIYTINNVFIQTDYNPKAIDTSGIAPDTLLYNNYYFLYSGHKLKFKPDILVQTIFIRKGDLYEVSDYEVSHKRLAELGIFKFINIRFEENKPDSLSLDRKYLLDCYIQLTPSAKQSFSIETEGTHNVGNLGVAGNFVYRNKNTFKGIEALELKLKGALEAQKTFIKAADNSGDIKLFLFNTYEIGPEANLSFPKFLLPFRINNLSKNFNPKTIIKTTYNYQQRPGFYNHSIANLSFGYSWKESRAKSHYFYPFENNLVKIDLDSIYSAGLNNSKKISLLNSYKSHLTTSSRYTFIYNNQETTKNKNFIFFRGNLEFAGNLIRRLNKSFKSPDDIDGSYQIFGIKYAQYFRPDVDLRYYDILKRKTSVVYRIAAGFGLPYGNSKIMPYEKSFFSGGSNGIRAWRARTLGPGSYKDTSLIKVEQTGDIKLEANIEYRFGIIKIIEGAVFIDAGNIWLLNTDPTRPKARFENKKFLGEFAIGAGMGTRLNFSFFIFRIDAAIPVKDPSKPSGSRWVLDDASLKKINFNLGIGYPF
jgi:outer membrane protein assembly factor BamA